MVGSGICSASAGYQCQQLARVYGWEDVSGLECAVHAHVHGSETDVTFAPRGWWWWDVATCCTLHRLIV